MALETREERSAPPSMEGVAQAVRQLVEEWTPQRRERQMRRALDPDDFDQLRNAGYFLVGVPVEFGGLWESGPKSSRAICEILRNLAHADPSLALAVSMHPAVLRMSGDAVPEAGEEAWAEQRRWIFQTVLDGAYWSTVASEPGSGGDGSKTKAVACRDRDGQWLISGQKHFGTGSGMAAYMITPAVPEGETAPANFFVDIRSLPWDGSAGVKLVAEWDGHGMAATQSHAFEFVDFPAIRKAKEIPTTMMFIPCIWSAIVLGIVETAMEEARGRLAGRLGSLRPYESVEWTNAEMQAWLIEAAYEKMLQAVEVEGRNAALETLQGKTSIAQLAESAMTRLCRVMGGSSYGRQSPFGFWFEDVRALGFLRPPWVLAYDNLGRMSWR